ncbi:hypothetical protein JCM13591A_00100 [Microbacterium xylanilyticum]
MADGWIYRRSADNSARFVLGTVGVNPLVCVGVNPSTAEPGAADHTVSKLAGFASRNGFDSWVMLNLYPQRSTDPTGMHAVFDAGLQAENERHIAEFLDGRRLSLLAAWGETIATRPYLLQMLAGIVSVARWAGCSWTSIGDLTKSGHPRHPSRAHYAWPLQDFDVESYLAASGKRPRGVAP